MTVNLNGDLSQWTLGTTFAACASGQQTADGWRLHKLGAAVHTVRQSTDVPHWSLCGRIIPYSLEIEVTTADASVGSSDVTALVYRGEGLEMAELIGGRMRVRGWLKGVAGIYALHLSNGAETLSYTQPVRVDDADKWTPFDVFAPWEDGDWWTDHRVGYSIALVLMAGANHLGEYDKWHSHAASALEWAGAGVSNFNATVGNKMKVCGLRVGDGPAMFQPADLVERDCMRYLEKSFKRSIAPAQNVGIETGELMWPAVKAGASIQFKSQRFMQPKRIIPAMTGYNPSAANAQATAATAGDCTGTTFDKISEFGFRVFGTPPAGTIEAEAIRHHWLADASLPAITTG